ncbi:MAG TPA: hypothetical protein VG434_09920 [Sphingomicrobium sp.]|nr:hypothetical protein [Sphingomicrobium sp.]
MMLLLLAAVSMSSPSVVDAERAYAAMAQEKGQWTAFRATAAPGAIMFVPDPVDAAEFLNNRKDPAVAVKWQPAQSYLSCDGKTGANLGPWQRPNSVGYFTTVWTRSGGAWRWNVDFGDGLKAAMAAAPAKLTPRRASCRLAKPALLPKLAAVDKSGSGSSADHSLEWTWRVEKNGSRHFLVYLWNGRGYDMVIDRTIAAD